MRLNDLIIRDPAISVGDPVFRGTRITVRTILASLANGDSIEQIVASFPALSAEQVRAAIEFTKEEGAYPLANRPNSSPRCSKFTY